MKSFFYIFSAFLAGCSTSHINYQTVNPPDHFYRNILVMYIEGELNIHNMDADSYQKEFMGRYNDLAGIEYRNHLEKSLSRNLKGLLTRVTRSGEIYPLNEPVPYREFIDTIDHQQIDAILLINLNAYWYRSYGSFNTQTGNYYEDSEPNASYQFYLIDVKTRKPVCMGVSRIYGLWAGYDTLNNKFARKLSDKLFKEKYIL